MHLQSLPLAKIIGLSYKSSLQQQSFENPAQPAPLNVLIGFEESQAIATAFRNHGANAFSCDLKPCSGGRPEIHLQCDIYEAIEALNWDLIVLHPPCTYTAACGNKHYAKTEIRKASAQFARDVWSHAKKAAAFAVLEQPITTIQKNIGTKSQAIHPWQFGHTERKETWIWLHNLPRLKPTKIMKERNQTLTNLPESKNRGELRSKTFAGIAAAMASQYSSYIIDAKARGAPAAILQASIWSDQF